MRINPRKTRKPQAESLPGQNVHTQIPSADPTKSVGKNSSPFPPLSFGASVTISAPHGPCLARHVRLNEFQCCVCGTEITRWQASLHHTCSFWKCRSEYNSRLRDQAREHEARQEGRRHEFRKTLYGYRDQHAVAAGVKNANEFVPVCVPNFTAALVTVPDDRRQKLRANLLDLINQAAVLDPTSTEDAKADDQDVSGDVGTTGVDSKQDLMPILLGNACATCGGNCCTGGGERGHLSAEKMRDYLDAHPHDEPSEIIDDYVSRVPQATYKGSCIFHGAEGCTLPREMRADICNDFECNGLKYIREEVLGKGHTRLFIVATNNEQISGQRFLDADHPGPTDSE